MASVSDALVLAALLFGATACSTARADARRADPAPVKAAPASPRELPPLLSETGLYAAGSADRVAPGVLFYVPQYPLWSDGAAKRRWILLPPDGKVDGSRPDAWDFPPGTRFWKEFTFAGERTETRYIERTADGSFRYASYVWDDARSDAVLAPESGVPHARTLAGGVAYDIPSQSDCRTCHEGRPGRILGFNALQLSSDRDPLAPHGEAVPPEAVDLRELARRDLIQGLQDTLLAVPPRIQAPTPAARAVAGYLFGNCAGCHNADGALAALDFDLDQSALPHADGYARLARNVIGRASGFRVPGRTASPRVAPGNPDESALFFRMQTRDAAQMPPLGTHVADRDALTLIGRWIATASHRSNQPKEPSP